MSKGENAHTDKISGKFEQMPQLNGIFVLDKPSGPSSARCLGIFKKLGQKKTGHAGTLDPLASGVLLVLLGQATKLSSWLMDGGHKIYSGVIRLGLETDTWDVAGQIVRETPCGHIRAEDVDLVMREWIGEIEQVAPPYSALKHNGQPLYRLARQGRETPEKTRKIKILNADMLHFNLPFVYFRVTCGSGSYIRSLAHSLGKRLGCGATLCRLTREYSHPFGLNEASTLAELRDFPELLASRLKPLEAGLPDWPIIELNACEAEDIRNGRPLHMSDRKALQPAQGQTRAILREGQIPLALATLGSGRTENCWTVLRGLWN